MAFLIMRAYWAEFGYVVGIRKGVWFEAWGACCFANDNTVTLQAFVIVCSILTGFSYFIA